VKRFECSACSQVFAGIAGFDWHRRGLRIVREHSSRVCYGLIKAGLHHKGECQNLVGQCRDGGERYVLRDGIWHDPTPKLWRGPTDGGHARDASADKYAVGASG
jgi:hypothetical protein